MCLFVCRVDCFVVCAVGGLCVSLFLGPSVRLFVFACRFVCFFLRDCVFVLCAGCVLPSVRPFSWQFVCLRPIGCCIGFVRSWFVCVCSFVSSFVLLTFPICLFLRAFVHYVLFVFGARACCFPLLSISFRLALFQFLFSFVSRVRVSFDCSFVGVGAFVFVCFSVCARFVVSVRVFCLCLRGVVGVPFCLFACLSFCLSLFV